MALNMLKEKWISPCLLTPCPQRFIHFVHFFKKPTLHFNFLKNLFSPLKISSFHNILNLYSSTPTSSSETHVPCASLELLCIIDILGIIFDMGPWRACRVGFKAPLSWIYSPTQEFKCKPTLLNTKFSKNTQTLRHQDWNQRRRY